jgi:class 3 adenylate cyclase/tetratricopeptide (TPR) repeat protein
VPVCPSCGHENREGTKFCEECGFSFSAAPARTTEQRRTVTVLFCDVTGSTALGETLDPERLRALLARYFERMKAIVESHGGTVEKFIGDAVMAVFGIPAAHEDDALRAVHAAVEMRDTLPELSLQGRIGVTTGEVVTGTEERLATGDAVNVAARLEQAARPGEVLLGDPTVQLVRGAVELSAGEPLELKGKAEPVAVYRLFAVRDAPERRHDMPFVGRERELTLLRVAWERARTGQRCELVTVVGEAGVGKSRLVAEALASLDATIARGRCLPYGEGITYWPVVEVLKQLDVTPPDETAALAIRALLGEAEAMSSPEEIAWAFRKTLEHAGEDRPLIVVFDDIQWGEETFRDLIEHVALLSTGVSLLLLCMARPELVERRPTWPVTVLLEPLRDEAAAELIPKRIAGDLRARIARAAGGNPLFVSEMLAIAGDGNRAVAVPPTLQALLAERLDQLEPPERGVLEHASVEGEIFHRGALQALGRDDAQVTPHLAALVRKGLIQPDRSQLAGEDGFRFRHLLIRDAAYDALPKTARAALHQQLAGWLEKHARDLVELDEIVGHHLEQALRYRTDVGLPEDGALAAAACTRLKSAGQRAARRSDYEAAARLFERAAALLPPSEVDVALESELTQVLSWTGRSVDAVRRADVVAERFTATGNRVGELTARIRAGAVRLVLEPEAETKRLDGLLAEALPELEAAGDELSLYVAYCALGDVAEARGRLDGALKAYECAYDHARRAGYEPFWMLGFLAWARCFGTTPVLDLLAWLDENEARAGPVQFFRAYRAWSLAKLGRFDDARGILVVARTHQAERGGGLLLANLIAFESASVELLAGDPEAAVALGMEGCRLHEELGERDVLAHSSGVLAQALYALDRLNEAEVWAARSAELARGKSVVTDWRSVRAKLLARRGDDSEACLLAAEAVRIADDTDMLERQGDTYADLAEVLVLAGRGDEAVTALEQAIERYERKGNIVSTQRARSRLAELQDAAPR